MMEMRSELGTKRPSEIHLVHSWKSLLQFEKASKLVKIHLERA